MRGSRDGDSTVVPEILTETDDRHPAFPELALDSVAAGQRGCQRGETVYRILEPKVAPR
jgi:hypothetical protein